MALTDEMKAFLVAACQLAGKGGKGTFSRDRVRLSLGLSILEEANAFDAFTARPDPPLLRESRYPNATVTADGRELALRLMRGDAPITRSQFNLLLGMWELGPGGQVVSFADGISAFLKKLGHVFVEDSQLQSANAMGELLAEHPYRFIHRSARKGHGSLTAKARELVRAAYAKGERESQDRFARFVEATARLHSESAETELQPSRRHDNDRSDEVRSADQPEAGPADVAGLRVCWIMAHNSYQRAILAPGGPQPKPLRGVWDWLREHDPDDYELPEFPTWSRYVRAYSQARSGARSAPRRGRTGRSTVRPDQI